MEGEKLLGSRAYQPKWTAAAAAADGIIHVPWFVMAGAEIFLRSMLRALLLSVAWFLILLAIVATDGMGGDASPVSIRALIPLVLLLGAGSVVLEMPSGLIARRIKGHHVAQLSSYVLRVAPTTSEVRLLRDGVSFAENASARRVSFIGWVLGLLWALLVWIAVRWVLGEDVAEATRSSAASYALVIALLVTLFAGVYASYRVAHRALSDLLAFALLEAERSLLADSS